MDSVPHQTLAEWVQAELAAREAEHTAYESLTRAKAGEATAANAPAPTDPAPATPSHEDLVNLGNCHITITTVSSFILETGLKSQLSQDLDTEVNFGFKHPFLETRTRELTIFSQGRSCFLVRPEVPRRYFEMEDYDDNGPEGDLNRWLVVCLSTFEQYYLIYPSR